MHPRLAIPLALDPAALAGIDPSAAIRWLTGVTMGTRWRVGLAARADAELGGLQAAIETRLDGLVAELSHWQEESLLGRFNRAPAGTWMMLPTDFAAVVAAGLDIAARSGGAFDPAIGRLVNLWGFGPEPHGCAPTEADRWAALAAGGWRRLAYDAAAKRLRQPGGLWLDLSGIAKGHAADAVAAVVARAGRRHALTEIGGECVGRGVRPDCEPWWVDLETPPGITLPPLRVALHGMAVATSGDYVRGAHTIDPRDGRPAHGLAAASVLARTAMAADAWASALMVLGLGDGATLAVREGLAARLISRTPDGGAREWISPALAALL